MWCWGIIGVACIVDTISRTDSASFQFWRRQQSRNAVTGRAYVCCIEVDLCRHTQGAILRPPQIGSLPPHRVNCVQCSDALYGVIAILPKLPFDQISTSLHSNRDSFFSRAIPVSPRKVKRTPKAATALFCHGSVLREVLR